MRMIRRCISTAIIMLLHLGMLFINFFLMSVSLSLYIVLHFFVDLLCQINLPLEKKLENCIFDICDWMRRNALKLNEDKTEFVIFSTKNNLRDNQCLIVGKDKIEVSD